MKIEITTSANNVEAANLFLSKAIETYEEFKDDPQMLGCVGVTKQDIEAAESFSKSLLKAFLK